MAGYPLIDEYLERLADRIGWHRDAEKVYAEVEDHMYSTAESLEAGGSDSEMAQQETIRRFGDPRLLTLELAVTPRGGLAIPTRFTKSAGVASIVGAVLWLGAVVSWWVAALIAQPAGVGYQWTSATPGYAAYLTGNLMLAIAVVLVLVMMTGLHRRHGGLGFLGWTALPFAGLAVFSLVVGGVGVFQVWEFYMAIATSLFAIALFRRDRAPRLPVIAFGSGLLVGTAVWMIVRAALASRYWDLGLFLGHHWVTNLIGATIAVVILALGMFGLGNWLRREEPVDLLAIDHVFST